jgi:hypothetical protein
MKSENNEMAYQQRKQRRNNQRAGEAKSWRRRKQPGVDSVINPAQARSSIESIGGGKSKNNGVSSVSVSWHQQWRHGVAAAKWRRRMASAWRSNA